MNKKGFGLFWKFMMVIAIFVIAIGLAEPMHQVTDEAKDVLNCTRTNLTDIEEAWCVTTDISPTFFIAGLIGIAGLIAGAKIITR